MALLWYAFPMKILHVISQTPDFTGSGKFIREIIHQSSQKGHANFLVAGAQKKFELSLACMDEKDASFVRFDGVDLDFPIPGMSDVMPYPSSVFSKLDQAKIDAYKAVFKERIQAAVETFKPDIIHTHHLWIVTSLARSVAPQIPLVTSCHGTCLRQHHLCPDTGQMITADLKRIDRVIALSRDQQKKIAGLLDFGPEKVPVISGGYNEQCFFYQPKKFDGTVELVYAGKLSAAKGVPWMLKSLEKIRHLPFRLHMAGSSSGPEKDLCLSLAEHLGDKVIYHGPLSHEKLGELMRKSHVFILPSFFEGMPLVLIEALACGCRIVSTALPGVTELFQTRHPEMIRLLDLPQLETIDQPFQKDEAALELLLSRSLEKLISDVINTPQPDQSYVRQIQARYTWERIFSNIEKVYLDLV